MTQFNFRGESHATLAESGEKAGRLTAVLVSALLGSFLIFGVGFAHSDVLHNAAHDTRHALGFPCH